MSCITAETSRTQVQQIIYLLCIITRIIKLLSTPMYWIHQNNIYLLTLVLNLTNWTLRSKIRNKPSRFKTKYILYIIENASLSTTHRPPWNTQKKQTHKGIFYFFLNQWYWNIWFFLSTNESYFKFFPNDTCCI